MKKVISILIIVLSGNFSFAQKYSPAPLSMYNFAAKLPPQTMIGILVQGDPGAVADAAAKHGGGFRYSEGTLCSVFIPAGQLIAFSNEPGIVRIGDAHHKLQTMNDTSKIQTRVNLVHAGMAPLTQAYEGDSVILGIIDTGIDFNHPDFKDSLGNTRVLYIWDQNHTVAQAPPPSPFAYGAEWDSAQINAGQCTEADTIFWGHGTETCGIIGGNGRSTNVRDYSGGAPHANYIVVALDLNYVNSATAVADAAKYIYDKAQALGRPCVINASVGDYYGSHDGQDPEALMIDSMLDTPGRVFVCAAGNGGNVPFHLSYTLSSDTNFTFYNNPSNDYIQVWADTNNFNNAKMAIGCTQPAPQWLDRGRTPFTTIAANLNLYNNDTIRNANGDRLAIVYRHAAIQGSAYEMEFQVVPDSSSYYVSLQMTGSGVFHDWCFDVADSSQLPSVAAYPKMVYYKNPDTTYTICSSFQCSNRTITVANYVNRNKWINVNDQWVNEPLVTAGQVSLSSSHGPTRDGRQKPDIGAPGDNTLTCTPLTMLPNLIANAPDEVAYGGYHVTGGGTSAASPCVAGCVALWLQKYPNSTWSDAKTAVTSCVITDNFTGTQLPDYTWGYGKVDAFGMLTNCFLTTNDHSVVQQNNLTLFPNPVNVFQNLQVNFTAVHFVTQLDIFSVNGQLVYSQNAQEGATSIVVPAHALATGMYFVRLKNESGIQTGKLVVE